jgi:hypothetical protein
MFGGSPGPAPTAATEEYNGATWTTGGNMGTARYGLAGAGIQTAALGFGGANPSRTGATEKYDGSTWTSSPVSLGTARAFLGGAGTQAAGLASGGDTPTNTTATEEFTITGTKNIKTITVS